MSGMRKVALSHSEDGRRPSPVRVRGLTGADILALRHRPADAPASRARMLATAVASPHEVAGLPWPDVERLLLACFVVTFGARPELMADCDTCGLRLELRPDLPAVLEDPPPNEGSVRLPPPHQACRLRYRAPTIEEMERAAALAPEPATEFLQHALVVGIEGSDGGPDSAEIDAPGLPAAIDAALAEHNAAGLHLIRSACPDCGGETLCRLDPLGLIEVEATRRNPIGEAQRLSETFGWTTDQALALPEVRRRALVAELASEARG
jgi:hypothetical protein